jgi:hypothetical protein
VTLSVQAVRHLTASMIGDSRPISVKVEADAGAVAVRRSDKHGTGHRGTRDQCAQARISQARQRRRNPGQLRADEANWRLSASDNGAGLRRDGSGRARTGLPRLQVGKATNLNKMTERGYLGEVRQRFCHGVVARPNPKRPSRALTNGFQKSAAHSLSVQNSLTHRASHICDGGHRSRGDHHHRGISGFIGRLDKVGKWDNPDVLVPRLFKLVLHLRVFR